MIRRTATVLLTGWLIACGGSVSGETGGSSGSSGSSGHSASIAEACRAFFRADQAVWTRCTTAPDPRPALEDAYIASCVNVFALPGVSVTADDIDACTATYLASSCGELPACLRGFLPAMDHPGTLPLGETCRVPAQCASGACLSPGSYSYRLGDCGTCAEARFEGQSCDQSHVCQDGLTCLDGVCDWPAEGPGRQCVKYGSNPCPHDLYCDAPMEGAQGVCRLDADVGQACGGPGATPCREELYCRQDVCAERLAEGASCDSPYACAEGVCEAGVCRSPHRVGEGQSCAFDLCSWGLLCSADLTCTKITHGAEGEKCGNGGECLAGLICAYGYLPGTPSGACVREPATGAPCVDLRCGPLGYCDGSDYGNNEPGRCAALGAVGQACPCIGTLECVDEVCQPLGTSVCL